MNTIQKKLLSAMITIPLALCSVPLETSAENPIVQTAYTADGAPMVWNDTFYMYTGHDEGNSGFFSMNEWRCYSTTDMKNWTDLGSPLAYTDFSWAKGEAWAAQCIERNGKFYYYVTVTAKSGGRAIGVAVADKPEGPFKDAIGKPLIGPMDGMKCIDPTVFLDDDGQAYLYFGNGELRYVQLNDDLISCKGEPVLVNTKNGTFGAAFDEAPYLYKHNGLYYMIYASDWLPQKVSYST
ncbi:MAG: family 43 glycosylhydrolase [Oscillospiraceae bacterium]|nr:family 43 glycosylhydrolase [Oscillospiraceae bacterium]